MKAVILLGGEATRLRPLTCNVVRPMLPVLNQPFLQYTLSHLKEHAIDDIMLILSYSPDPIRDYFGDGSSFGVKLTYIVEDLPLGTAGVLKSVESRLDGTFLVFFGEIFTDIDIGAMASFHYKQEAKATLALTPEVDPSLYVIVETDAEGRVTRFIEKPSPQQVTTNLINAGLYILDPEVLREIPPHTYSMFEYHLLPALLGKGMPIYGYPSDAYWIDIGTPQRYLKLHRDLLQGKSVSVPYSGEIKRGMQTTINSTAKIEGALVVGDYCDIGSGVEIKGPTVVGSNCQIGTEARIERAIIWRNVRVGEHVSLSNCIIGDDSVIGDDSLVPEGSIIGDNVEVMPGTKLQPGATIWPGTKVEAKRRQCFLAIPSSENSRLLHELITEALQGIGVETILSEEEIKVGASMIKMVQQAIDRADFIIADLTGNNPDIMYEVGYAHALGKPVLPLLQRGGHIPSDLGGYFYVVYEPSRPEELRRNIQIWAART